MSDYLFTNAPLQNMLILSAGIFCLAYDQCGLPQAGRTLRAQIRFF